MRRSDTFSVVAGILLAVLAVEGVIRLLDPWIPGPSEWPTASTHVKTSQLDEQAADVDIVLVGSSITDAAVDPELLADLVGYEAGYNAATPFFSPFVAETWLRTTLRRSDFKPDIAIIGMPIFPGLTDDGANFLAGWIDEAREREEQSRDPFFPAIISNRGVFASWDHIALWEDARQQGSWTESGHFTSYDQDYNTATDLEALPPEPRLSTKEESALRSLVSTLKDKGALVALTIEPGRYPGGADPHVVDAFVESIKSIAAESGARFWNAYEIDWPDELYADTFHFNQAGMRIYTERLATQIAEWRSHKSHDTST